MKLGGIYHKGELPMEVVKEQLRSIIERIEKLESEKKDIGLDIRDVYSEAKGQGFDPRALRAIVKMRKQDAEERAEQEAILETYMLALGMLSDLPLGQAAIERATAPAKPTRSRQPVQHDVTKVLDEA